MKSMEQLSSCDYDGVNAGEDTTGNSNDMDVDCGGDMEKFEDDSMSISDVAFGTLPLWKTNCSRRKCCNSKAIRYVSPLLLVLVIGGACLFLAGRLLVGNNFFKGPDCVSAANISYASPFFEHVLEWKEDVPPSESRISDFSPNGNGIINNNNSSSKSERTNADPFASNQHYRASIEFCSDPSKGLYGYGPVGNCVPGRPAPLIRMQPKRFYHLTLYNNAHIDTNLHTHGLHVSGVGTVDDVTRVAKPGECLVYDHYILDDADVGTFWYHPHRHPHAQDTAYGGAYGMLIIDETNFTTNAQKHYPKHIVNFLAKNEVLLQFSSMYNKKLSNPVRTNKVNGQSNLDIFLSPDAYYYFRISAVAFDDAINYVEFDPPDACNVRIVAYDGVYRSEIPGKEPFHKHMMTVGSRSDLAVACHKHADIHFHQGNFTKQSKLVTIHLETKESRESSISPSAANNPTSLSIPATLPSSPYWDLETEMTWKPRRPYYMPDLANPVNKVDEYWSVALDDHFANGTHGHLINQHKWDANNSIQTFSLGQLVEYPILKSQEHPFHSHINRMQIVEPGGCGGRFEEGEYFDTIAQTKDTPGGGCRVRTKFFDFAGRVVLHCHRFEHEDHGMMAWIDVLGGDGHGRMGDPATRCLAEL